MHLNRPSFRGALLTTVCGALAALTGCQGEYVVPGRGADMSQFGLASQPLPGLTNQPVSTRLALRPMVTFPATVALVRVQEPHYRSPTAESYGHGAFSVVTTRDIEKDEHFERLRKLPMLEGVATLNRLLLPRELKSDADLRNAAAALQAQLVLIYTIDTTFYKENVFAPLTLFTLGASPNLVVHVNTTASALLIDTRNGYIYGLAEASSKHDQLASLWTGKEAVDQSRRKTESEAFEKLVTHFEQVWPQIVAQYGGTAVQR